MKKLIAGVIIVIALGAILIVNYTSRETVSLPPPPNFLPTPPPPPPPEIQSFNTGFHGNNPSEIPKDVMIVGMEKGFFFGPGFSPDQKPPTRFLPYQLTIKVGETVYFVNNDQDNKEHWPAAAIHPTHQTYPNSDINKCGTEEASKIFDACRGVPKDHFWAFTFGEPGVWQYHDHLNTQPTIATINVIASNAGVTDGEALKIAKENGFVLDIYNNASSFNNDHIYRDITNRLFPNKIFLRSCKAGKEMVLDALKGTILSFRDFECSAPAIEDLGKLNVWKTPEVQTLVKKHGSHVLIKALDIKLIEDIEYIKKIHPQFKEETGCIIVAYVHGGGEGYVYQEDKKLNIIYKETLEEFMEKTSNSDPEVMSKFYLSLH